MKLLKICLFSEERFRVDSFMQTEKRQISLRIKLGIRFLEYHQYITLSFVVPLLYIHLFTMFNFGFNKILVDLHYFI